MKSKVSEIVNSRHLRYVLGILSFVWLLFLAIMVPISAQSSETSLADYPGDVRTGFDLINGTTLGFDPDVSTEYLTTTISETLIVPFRNGIRGVQTSRSYSDRVTVTVEGIGQASGPSWSDAFYIFTDYDGNLVTPYHETSHFNYSLWIDGGPPDSLVVPIPLYNPNHIYTFELEGDGNPFNFAVGDNGKTDNTGAYTVIIESEQSPPPIPGRTIQSLRALSVPTIDGDLSDWPSTSGTILSVSTVNLVNGIRPSTADVSASVLSMWTDSMLYFAVEITDNALVADSGNVWEDDAFEIALDALHDHQSGGVDDHQYTTAVDGRKADFGVPDNNYIAAVQTRIDGWNLEVAVPVGNLGLARFTSGKIMGLNLGLIDDDLIGGNDSHLLWESDRTWQAMPDWGQIQLVENNIPPMTPEPMPTSTPNGTTLTLQQGQQNYRETADTYIQEWTSDQNFGADQTFTVRSNGIASTLIFFDIDTVPEHARIKRATLSLYSVDRSNPQWFMGVAYRLLRPWAELETTWHRARVGAPWGISGANGVGDRDYEPISSQVIDTLDNWASFDITELVQMWINDPDQNYGLMIQGDRGGSVAYDFISREVTHWADTPYRPELIITYWDPQPTPTPTESPTPTPSPTPTLTPTSTPTPTLTPSPTPTCLDAYEPDNTYTQSKIILVDDDPQQHNFHQPGDIDYVKFGVTAGTSLTLYTGNLGPGTDTTLTLYDTDGVTQLAYNDIDPLNPPASRIDWTAPASGTYFLKAAHFSAEVGGCDMTYELAVKRTDLTPTPMPLYLPLMLK